MQVNAGGSYPDGIVLIDKDTGLPYNALAGDAIPVTGATTAISTAIVDGSGNQITSFGGGVQYTEGDTDATITGTALMFESNTGTNTISVVSSSAPLPISSSGNVAHDAADSGNPVKIGGKARQTNPAAVADADRVDGFFDDVGRQVVLLNQARDLTSVQATTITSSVAETTIVTAGGAGVFNDLTGLVITNSSATATLVTLKDSTGGTTRGIYSIAANGGIVIPFPTPLAQATANNNWTLTCGTSVASIYVQAQFAKNV